MIHRPLGFADILAHGLGGAKNFAEYVNTLFAEKFNNPKLTGFDWDDEIQNGFEYSQIEAEADAYTMATVVDYDAQGNIKGHKTVKTSTGDIPRMRHGFRIDERTIREKTNLAMEMGKLSDNMRNVIEGLLFNSVDKLLGGNKMSLNYQRHRVVSTGMYEVTGENNIGGLQNVTFDFKVPAINKVKTGFGTYGTKNAWSHPDADPIGDLRDMVALAKASHYEYGHFEISEAKWMQFINHPNVRKVVMTTLNPATDAANIGSILFTEDMIKNVLTGMRIPPIMIVTDDFAQVEKFNEATRELELVTLDAFDQDVVVLVPNGDLGTIKAVRPVTIGDPASRETLFNGGRTKIVQSFNAKTTTQEIESELTALVVPTKARFFIILNTTEATV